jgi:hypothetical protein
LKSNLEGFFSEGKETMQKATMLLLSSDHRPPEPLVKTKLLASMQK